MTDTEQSGKGLDISIKPSPRMRMVFVCLVFGLAFTAADRMGGNRKGAIANLLVYGAIITWYAFGKGDFLDTLLQMDERQKDIVGKARAFTAVLMSWVLVGWAVSNFAQGNFTGPAVKLCFVMGATFLVSVLYYRRRS